MTEEKHEHAVTGFYKLIHFCIGLVPLCIPVCIKSVTYTISGMFLTVACY